MPDLPIGRIAGSFGLRGELKCDPTSAGRTLFIPDAVLRCENEGGSRDVRLAGVREHKGRLLLRLDGIESANDADALQGATFFAPREALDIGPDEYLDIDVVGCELLAPDGATLGRVSAVRHYPASDMLIVGGKMVPLVAAFVREMDVAHKRIVMELPPGLLDDDEASV
jgi:16S rRNA processing protein RimM